MKRIVVNRLANMVPDIGREAGVDFVEDILAIVKRPHFANGFIADSRHDAAKIIEDGIDRLTLNLTI